MRNLQVAALWVYWGFAFDDARCDDGPLSVDAAEFLAMACRMQRALEVPDETPPDDDVFAVALHDIGRRFRECATPVQVRRFNEAHRSWLMAVAWQIGNNQRGYMPSLDEYVTLRLGSSGGPPTLAMLEIANGAEVPASEMDSPPVRALTEMTWLVAALDNDLHSYQREINDGHTDQNIISVHVHRYGRTVTEAGKLAVALRDRIMHRFLRLREQLFTSASPALACYLRGLGHGIRGNIDWGLKTPRYTGDEWSNTPGDTSGKTPGWADEPSDTDLHPPDVPSIEWWWRSFRNP